MLDHNETTSLSHLLIPYLLCTCDGQRPAISKLPKSASKGQFLSEHGIYPRKSRPSAPLIPLW